MPYQRQSGTEQRAERRSRKRLIWPSADRGAYVRAKHGPIGSRAA